MWISKLPRVAASVLSIAATAVVLTLLIFLSRNPHQDTYLGVEAKLQYLSGLTGTIDELFNDAISLSETSVAASADLAKNLVRVQGSVQRDLKLIYAPSTGLGQLNQDLLRALSQADSKTSTRDSDDTMRQRAGSVFEDGARLAQSVAKLAPMQREYHDAAAAMRETSRALIAGLRERGKEDLADTMFRSMQRITARIDQAAPQDLEQTMGLLNTLGQAGESLPLRDQQELREVVVQTQRLISAARDLEEIAASSGLTGYAQNVDSLRESISADYLMTLSTVNTVRVLLNVSTGFLLLGLGYFGFRLKRSYSALNHSHDDLELRVSERTADLETAMEDLKESQVQLVQAEKMSSLGQLVAGVMHEINTPLLYVLNNTSVTSELVTELSEYVDATLPVARARNSADAQVALGNLMRSRDSLGLDELDSSLEEMTTLASDSIEGLHQISELVQSLKDFSRLDRAAQDRFDVREGLEKTLVITRNVLKYGVEIVTDFQETPDIFCSPSRLNQVFVNLVTNAVQSMDGEGTLTISTRGVDDHVEIVIADTGCGIPEENLQKILDPFFTTKPVGQGTGLGLSIVHKIIKEHGGTLEVQSEVGVGTRFTIALPIRHIAEAANDDSADSARSDNTGEAA